MIPGYVEDEDEYNISKHLLEKFVCLIPVLGIVDGNTAIDLSIEVLEMSCVYLFIGEYSL